MWVYSLFYVRPFFGICQISTQFYINVVNFQLFKFAYTFLYEAISHRCQFSNFSSLWPYIDMTDLIKWLRGIWFDLTYLVTEFSSMRSYFGVVNLNYLKFIDKLLWMRQTWRCQFSTFCLNSQIWLQTFLVEA